MLLRSVPVSVGLMVLVALGWLQPTDATAQQLPLRPPATGGYPIVPVVEGWWDNGDGTFTVSFGYVNRNEQVLEIPIGEDNSIEPAELSGMQPTTFLTGRHHGVFTVTYGEDQRDSGAIWSIRANGEQTRVPGRAVSTPYELDKRPRPHGTVPPVIRFGEGGEEGQYPWGVVSSHPETVRVGELLTLAVDVEDISVRDPSDYRFAEPLDVAVTWYKHQGPPGEIEWVRHPSTPEPPPPPADSTDAGPRRPSRPPSPSEITVENGKGTALVQARFPAPGEYLLRVRADQFASAPDSGAGDQCCWTNGYVRVTVTP